MGFFFSLFFLNFEGDLVPHVLLSPFSQICFEMMRMFHFVQHQLKYDAFVINIHNLRNAHDIPLVR